MHPPSTSEYSTQRHQARMKHEEEMSSFQGKPNQHGQNKNSMMNQYYRQEETRYTPQGHTQIVERRTDGHPAEDSRASNEHLHYTFPSRDGPSPGRNYNYGIQQGEAQQGEHQPLHSSHHINHPFRSPLPASSRSKRKVQTGNPTTPDRPILISNQSSDDSINALLPPNKRARVGSLLPTDSASFFKSFTLSPMNSRTFSRDEKFDMPRFQPSRGSAEGNRIFQSWSSGNSRTENHSPSDVRNCYDDWHSTAGRRESFMNGYSRPTDNQGRVDHASEPPSQSQSSYNSRGHGLPPQHWQGPVPGREQQRQPHGHPKNTFDSTYQSPPSQLQPLHPEDRYHEQLLQGYGQGMDMNRPYWNTQGPPVHQLYISQNRQGRDDTEERSTNNHMMRGNPPHPHPHHQSRVSAQTPPVRNGDYRYSSNYHPSMYDVHSHGRNIHQPYDNWGQQSMRGGRYNGTFNSNMPMKDSVAPSYSDKLTHLKSVTIESGANGSTGMRTADGILLLSLPEDRISLSETLCIVRENVEVFIATEADVKAPAPGRKRPVVEGQVGLRCIHCRAAVHQSEKVKRAVCFPSSIKRIYRTVIDMKLDHFKACRFVPIELKLKLEELRATNARSTGTTMQYFVQAAKRMGMLDGGHGIRFEKPICKEAKTKSKEISTELVGVKKESPDTSSIMRRPSGKPTPNSSVPSGVSFSLSLDLSISGDSNGESSKLKGLETGKDKSVEMVKKEDMKMYAGKVVLALPEDKSALSPLRCFLRDNVCAFSATAEDIAVRTPTTFSVVLGQVGIGCIHCLSLPARERSNRAVCFPFSIARIYQSVADIQRFHLGECKMVPPTVKARFLELQNASSKGSKGLATRQYWVSSAKKLGLVDSECGIRFARDPSIPLEKAKSLDILAQVASDVTTAAQPLVLPEDKPLIAEFLYLVMKQLQPCRFTEADRNKRRLKDVGCIGVECKHCAGQVDGRKFFWSSVNAVESNFVSVHTHMMECRAISQELKDKLATLKTLRKEQTTRLKSGSQKAFFSRVWKRLHSEGNKIPSGGASIQKRTPGPKPLAVEEFKTQEGLKRSLPPTTVNVSSPKPSHSTPPVERFKSSADSSPPTSISTSNSNSTKEIQTKHLNMKQEGSIPTFPSPVFTTKPEGFAKEEADMVSMNASLMSSPMSPSETGSNSSKADSKGQGGKNNDDFNVSVMEEI